MTESLDDLRAMLRLPEPTDHGRRNAVVIATAAAVATVLLAAVVVRSAPGGPTPAPATVESSPAPPMPSEASSVPEATDEAPSPVPVGPGQDCRPLAAVLAADVDGDGCADALSYTDGMLAGAGARWNVGEAGDQVATGDWWCKGVRTLALLRPATGEVFAFEEWAQPDADVTVEPVGRVEGATVLRAADLDGDGCHELVVEHREGPAETVPLARGTATP